MVEPGDDDVVEEDMVALAYHDIHNHEVEEDMVELDDGDEVVDTHQVLDYKEVQELDDFHLLYQ